MMQRKGKRGVFTYSSVRRNKYKLCQPDIRDMAIKRKI